MFRRTFEITLSTVLVTTALAFLFATGVFLVVGVGYVIEHPAGTVNNLLVALFMMGITAVLLTGAYRLSRPFIEGREEVSLGNQEARERSGKVFQIKRDQPAATD